MDAISAAGTPCPETSAMSRPGLRVVAYEKIVEVSGYGSHGNVARSHSKIPRNRELGGKNRELRHLKFLLNLAELLIAL
jgi:hypothetical protein